MRPFLLLTCTLVVSAFSSGCMSRASSTLQPYELAAERVAPRHATSFTYLPDSPCSLYVEHPAYCLGGSLVECVNGVDRRTTCGHGCEASDNTSISSRCADAEQLAGAL
jgi:hypothetical protein